MKGRKWGGGEERGKEDAPLMNDEMKKKCIDFLNQSLSTY